MLSIVSSVETKEVQRGKLDSALLCSTAFVCKLSHRSWYICVLGLGIWDTYVCIVIHMTHFSAVSEVLADCPLSKDEGANSCSLVLPSVGPRLSGGRDWGGAKCTTETSPQESSCSSSRSRSAFVSWSQMDSMHLFLRRIQILNCRMLRVERNPKDHPVQTHI